MSVEVRIRPATDADVEFLFAMILELAEYERSPESVTGTPAMLRECLFGERPCAEAVIAELDGESAGIAIFYTSFSTWECRPGIYLEDVVVSERFRNGHGIGEALLRHLARETVQRGGSRLEWVALDWNTPALHFYEKHGSQVMREWLGHRLSGDELTTFAAGGEPA